MKTALSLVDSGGDRLRVEVPENKDTSIVASGAVCNLRIGKRGFAPDMMQLEWLIRVLRRVANGVNSINKVGAHVSNTPEWQSAGGTAWLSIGSFRVVLRLELNGSCTGWIDRNYTQITDTQTFDTREAGQVTMMQLLRDYIANEVRELGQMAISLGGDK